MIRIADRYLGRAALTGILLAAAALLAMDVFFALVGEFSDVGKGDYRYVHALGYVALTLPRRLYDLFPVAAVVGTLIGVGGLASSGELVVFRAAGMSRLRIAVGVILATAVVLSMVVASAELIAPRTESMAQAMRTSAQSGNLGVGADASIWVRDGDRYINARRPLVTRNQAGDTVKLADIDVFEFGEQGLESIAHADSAENTDDGWAVTNIVRSNIRGDRVEVDNIEQGRWESLVDPAVLATAITRPQHLSLSQLRPYVRYLEANGLDAGPYRSAMRWRLCYPLAVVMVVLAGMIFVFGPQRSTSFGQRLFLGMLLGIGFYLSNRIAVSLGDVYNLPAPLMAAMPSLMLGMLSIYYLKKES